MRSRGPLLQGRQPLSTDRALQPKPHPALQTLRMEDMPARRDHVCPPAQHAGAQRALALRHPAERHDRYFQVLHTDGAVEDAQAGFRDAALRAGRIASSAIVCARRLGEADWQVSLVGGLFVAFSEDRVVVVSVWSPAGRDEEAGTEEFLGSESAELKPEVSG